MKFLRILLFCAALCLASAACGPAATPTLPPSPTAPPVPPTATVAPTATPLPGKMIAAGTVDPLARDWLAAQAAQVGLVFEERSQISPADLSAETRIVVLFDPLSGLNELLAAAPQAQFAAVTADPLEPAANLTVIRTSVERQAFAAGFLAVILSKDWRAAGLLPADQPALARAFQNGGGYFCGDCAPGWPLGATFPQVSASGTDGASWAAEVNTLFDSAKAEIFYLSAGAYQPEVYAALAGRVQVERTVVVLGSLPPPAELKAQWAATVGTDALVPLQQALPEMLAGKSAGLLTASVRLSDVNPNLLGAGRQALFERMLADLEKGFIQTGSVE
jgi:hypothetical protein